MLITSAVGATAEPGDEVDPATLPSAEALTGTDADTTALKVQSLAGLSGPTEAFVEFTDSTTREAVAQSRSASPQAVADTAQQQIESTADEVVDDLGDVTVLYTATNGLAGVAVSADADALRALADRDDVVSVKPIIPKERQSNAGIDLFTGSAASWQNAGVTGEGQTIAVIDSGIDFTHASFNADPQYAYPAELNDATKTLLATEPEWPQGKVLGGYDFAGLNYTAAAGQLPEPDANPLDEAPGLCGEVPPTSPRSDGHGSHVAGTAAGWGVEADGTTFEGDYTTLGEEELLAMQVGPGSAPDADLVALKIFGCAGSSSVTGAALDWLLDPTNELAQQVTVVNMSIGSTFSTVDDPENALIDQLVDEGVVVVTSAGNSGDTHDIGGSPGNANSSLSVANSVADTFNFEGAAVTVGDGESETVPGQYSIAYTFPNGPVGPSEVVTLETPLLPAPSAQFPEPSELDYYSGCFPYSPEDAANVAGKTVVVAWDDTVGLPCGSAARAGNAAVAGASGIVFTGLSEVFAAGLSGDERIPTFQFTGPVTAELLDYTPATGVITIPEPLEITYDNSLSVLSVAAPSVADTLNDSSSRGVHGSLGSTKPDVAAPGTTIASVAVGSGNGWTNKSGTSMAAPHAAGVAALTRAAHPDWSAAQVKAGVMNTATHDVTIGDVAFGPQRVGSGRVDAFDSVNNTVIAYDKGNSDGVSVGFGVVELDPTRATSITRTVEMLNTGDAEVTLGVGYTAQTTVPGVEYTLSASSVTVPAGGTAEVDVTLSVADPAAVARTLDPSMAPSQVAGLPREFLTIPQGWIELTGAPEVETLRVPVSAAVKPSSAVAAGPIVFGSDVATSTHVGLAGRGVDQEGYLSATVPLNLAAESPLLDADADASLQAADIKAVGTSQYYLDADTPYIGFGVETHGPWATLGASNSLLIEVDTPRVRTRSSCRSTTTGSTGTTSLSCSSTTRRGPTPVWSSSTTSRRRSTPTPSTRRRPCCPCRPSRWASHRRRSRRGTFRSPTA
ncbi:peptidase S8 [Litorihabitans aurantiacus]|uniref:Peptidase S8 n=1 Tax=Litorihabitans aurantiacus TaxID=1930061 RepID=A0AA37XEW1_9MICO|nr:peptidase S8 [Litorihabitans aurantiacus]